MEYIVSEFGDDTVAGNCYSKKKKGIISIYDHPGSSDFLVGICIRPQLLIKVLLD